MANFRRKQGRGFINPDKSCTTAYHWVVEVWEMHGNDNYKPSISAEFGVSDSASMYFSGRKGDLRQLQNLRKALNEFEQALEDAQEFVEGQDAKSKDTA